MGYCPRETTPKKIETTAQAPPERFLEILARLDASTVIGGELSWTGWNQDLDIV